MRISRIDFVRLTLVTQIGKLYYELYKAEDTLAYLVDDKVLQFTEVDKVNAAGSK